MSGANGVQSRTEAFNDAVRSTVLLKDASPENLTNIVKAIFVGGRTEVSEREDPDIGSRQIKDDPFETHAAGEYILPKYDPAVWAAAMEHSSRLSRCIRTMSRNTVGLGWFVEPLQTLTPDTPDKQRKMIEAQRQRVRAILDLPNDDMSWTSIWECIKIDEEASGNGYLEVVRNARGEIAKFFHAPAVTMRIRRLLSRGAHSVSGDQNSPEQRPTYGFVQVRGERKKYFKEFGDRRVMDASTGKWYEGATVLPVWQRASEILHFKIYSPTSTYYGVPRYVSAATAIAGNRLAALRNVTFFDNDAVPRMAVLVSGGRLSKDSIQSLEEFFRVKAQGVQDAHRIVVLQVEPTKIGFQQQSQTNIELKPLTVGVTEDSSFGQYRKDNDEEIREIFGLAPVFFQTADANKASAAVSREITNEQEFEPERLKLEFIINNKLIKDILNGGYAGDASDSRDTDPVVKAENLIRYRFERMQLTDPQDKARIDQIYASLGALTVNELRESLGKPRFDIEKFPFANRPLAIAMAELSIGLALTLEGQEASDEAAEQGAPGAPGAPGGAPGGDEGGMAAMLSAPPEAPAEGKSEDGSNTSADPVEESVVGTAGDSDEVVDPRIEVEIAGILKPQARQSTLENVQSSGDANASGESALRTSVESRRTLTPSTRGTPAMKPVAVRAVQAGPRPVLNVQGRMANAHQSKKQAAQIAIELMQNARELTLKTVETMGGRHE